MGVKNFHPRIDRTNWVYNLESIDLGLGRKVTNE